MKASIVEREMINRDMGFCLATAGSNSDLSFQLLPYVCLIVLESCNYFQVSVNDVHLEQIRAKAKQLDDTKLNIPGSIQLLRTIQEDHYKYYRTLPKGRLRWIKRLIQKDLGEYKYKGRFLSTTLLNNYLISLSSRNTEMKELMGGKAFNVGHSIGLLIGEMLREKMLSVAYPADKILLLSQPITSTDYHSRRYFKNKFNEDLSQELTHLFQLYLSMLNFVFHILGSDTVNSFTLFKIRYITLYHFVSSMRKMQSYFHLNGLMNDKNQVFFKTLCSDPFSKKVISNKQFRNILVHYKLPNQEIEVDQCDLVSGLAAHYFRDSAGTELSMKLDLKIQSDIETLENWMRPG